MDSSYRVVMDTKILLETRHLAVMAQLFPSDTVFITFNELGLVAKDRKIWGSDLFLKQQISAIGIVSVEPNWYPASDMKEAVAVINAVTRGKRVVTYGYSQGAYGALKFANAVRAQAAVAFSPQFSIDPSVVGAFDGRYLHYHRPGLNNGGAITRDDLCERNYVFVDPYSPVDMQHLARIRDIALHPAQIDVVPVPFTSHDTIRIVSEGKIGSTLVGAFTHAGLPDKTALRSLIRSARLISPTYQQGKLTHLLKRADSNRRIRFLGRGVASAPTALKRLLESCLLAVNGTQQAAAALLASIPDAPFGALSWHVLWHFFRRHKFKVGELRLAAAMEALHAGDVHARVHAVMSYLAHGKTLEATAALDAILRMQGAVDVINHVLSFALQLKNTEIMERILNDPSINLRLDPKQAAATRLKLAGMQAVLVRDEAVMKSLKPLAATTSLDPDELKQILEHIAAMDNHDVALRFAKAHFSPTDSELEYLRLQQIGHLIRKQPDQARRKLRDLRDSLRPDSVHWQLCARHFEAIGDVVGATRAQKNAVRVASTLTMPELRLNLARFHAHQKNRLRALFQFLVVYARTGRALETLRSGRDMATRLKYHGMALLFAKALYQQRSDNADELVTLCIIHGSSRFGSRRTSSALATQAIQLIQGGHELSEGSWHLLIDVLYRHKRREDADGLLKLGLKKFPRNHELLKFVKADSLIKKLKDQSQLVSAD